MPKVLVVYDVSRSSPSGEFITWAYGRRALALQKFAPDDFEVEICPSECVPYRRSIEFDLMFNLEYAIANMVNTWRAQGAGRRPYMLSFNSDSRRRHHFWGNAIKHTRDNGMLVINNVEAFEHYGREKQTCCISNGVDIDVFKPTVPISQRPHRCLWMGSTGPTKMKGWQEVFEPLQEAPSPRDRDKRPMAIPIAQRSHGFETHFRPIDHIDFERVRPLEETIDYYNSGSYVLCASLSEGTPNYVTEAVACGCVAVTLRVGNAQEWGVDRENIVFVEERTPEAFIEALRYARDNRERLSAAGVETMRQWHYGLPGDRAAYYFAVMRKMIAGDPVEPFSYCEKRPEEV